MSSFECICENLINAYYYFLNTVHVDKCLFFRMYLKKFN